MLEICLKLMRVVAVSALPFHPASCLTLPCVRSRVHEREASAQPFNVHRYTCRAFERMTKMEQQNGLD
jgi:hypothetical protein